MHLQDHSPHHELSRLAPARIFPAPFQDRCASLASCAAEAARQAGSPQRLFDGGHSAGGHLAELMAVRHDCQSSLGLPADVAHACLPIPYARAISDQASQIRQIQGTPAPFLLVCGADDFPHLIRQAETICATLLGAGSEVQLFTSPGCDQFADHLAASDATGPWAPRAIA